MCLALIDDQRNIYLRNLCWGYVRIMKNSKINYHIINKRGILYTVYEGKLSLSKDMLRHMPKTISFFLYIYTCIYLHKVLQGIRLIVRLFGHM